MVVGGGIFIDDMFVCGGFVNVFIMIFWYFEVIFEILGVVQLDWFFLFSEFFFFGF